MSMISAQCDELRERAKELRNLAPDPDVPYLVPSTKETMALAMRSAAGEMEDAADTIWQLRESVHRERAEADRLRELCADMVKMLVLACWASVESDEQASQCIYRAEALGIEVDE